VKLWILLFLLSVSMEGLLAQADSPAYTRFPNIPPLNLVQVDSTLLTKENLKKHQATMIMYFSPSCEHCQHQMEDIAKHMSELKKIQIIMVTYQPWDEMVTFYKNYKIASYPNIKMGRDAKFTLPPFYHINSLPFMALYDKKGTFITSFEGNVKIEKLLEAFSKKS
jgi:thioredoxin-related protein